MSGLHHHEKWFARGKSIFQNAHLPLDDKPIINTHADGIAAGNTMKEAIFHGLMEVIERDAWSFAKFSGDADDAVAIGDRPENKFLMDIVDHYVRASMEIVAKDIEQVITILKSHGYERLIAVDLTLPEIGILIIRIIVPGMEAFCFDKTRRGERLFRSQD
ncbi:MAG: YcaO-like family protein [Deltaproteobacteria bacterium]|nr:YcaO-like family protein [Deltaproteobacteria bacterium]